MKLDPHKYYVLANGKVRLAPKDFDLTSWKNNHPEWIVAASNPRGIGTRPLISTVFLFSPFYGPSGKPDALWETMIFWPDHPSLNNFIVRYTSLEDAQEGHKKALAWVEAAMEPYDG